MGEKCIYTLILHQLARKIGKQEYDQKFIVIIMLHEKETSVTKDKLYPMIQLLNISNSLYLKIQYSNLCQVIAPDIHFYQH